ncbi:MAG: hypothetical protein EOP52_00360 [Sphingobacteriales bacterium]|nr:MAG: hypothetical protein EOP52_00360 [Sphingobacteriales bacterium]
MKKILSLLAALVLTIVVQAQVARNTPVEEPFRLQAKAMLRVRNMGDSMVLRWALLAQDPWPFVQETGFDLERVELDASNKVLTEQWVRLNKEPLRPLSAPAFNALIAQVPEDENLKTAAGMLYGTLEQPIEAANPIGLIKARADEAQNRYGFMLLAADFSARAAQALGLRYVDPDIRPGHRYAYRIVVRPTGGGYPQDTALAFAVATPYQRLQSPVGLQAASGDKTVTLSWRNNPLNPFSAYWIERSRDGIQFQRLNKRPFLQMSLSPVAVKPDEVITYRDSVPRNYESYTYRVIGINGFSEQSGPSGTIPGMGIDQSFSLPIAIEGIKPSPQGLQVSWTTGDRPKDLSRFEVLASPSLEGSYQSVSGTIAPAGTSAVVRNEAPNGAYYQVVAYDTAGNRAQSLPLYYFEYDTIPPPVPVGLSGAIDTTGAVTVRWPMPQDGDARAFRLYTANDATHTFIPLLEAPIADTVYRFTTTLNTLTKDLFVKISAVDANGNHSELSVPVRMRRPDRIAPAEVVIESYAITDSAVTLRWQPSASEDVALQTIFRKASTAPDEAWQKLTDVDKAVLEYTDRTARPGEDWLYSIRVTDSAGLMSAYAFPLAAKMHPAVPIAGLQNLRAAAEKGTVALRWNTAGSRKAALLIARSYNGVGFVPVARLGVGNDTWTDEQLVGKGRYQYRVQQILDDGSETNWVLSNEVQVD